MMRQAPMFFILSVFFYVLLVDNFQTLLLIHMFIDILKEYKSFVRFCIIKLQTNKFKIANKKELSTSNPSKDF